MTRMRGLLFRLALVSTLVFTMLPAGAANVPVFSSPNVEVIAQLPDVQLMGGRIIGNLLYATGSTGLRIYDISNPEQPVPVGVFPMEIFSNEDVSVSASRKLVFISVDNAGFEVPSGAGLFIIDVANPMLPMLKGQVLYDFSGVGHTFTCINDCAKYGYVTGDGAGRIMVFDVVNAASPKFVKYVSTGAGTGPTNVWRQVHDVFPETATTAWALGTRGIEKMNVANPLSPTRILGTTSTQNAQHNQFIFHNALLRGSTLLVSEEDWVNTSCKLSQDLSSRPEGSFQTWQVNAGSLSALDQWATELSFGRIGIGSDAPATTFCSAHWFDYNDRGIVAIGWYQQGIRFLDVTVPGNIRQVGYYLPPWEQAGLGVSHVLFAPGRRDIVYGMSLSSGLIVLRIANGGAAASTVVAPILKEWLQPAPPGFFDTIKPHPTFGYACAVRIPR